MIEQIHQNQYRVVPRQITNRMDPFMFGNHQQFQPPNRAPMNIKGLLKTNMLQNPKINKGVGGFASILENLQQVLRVVETTSPLIKEYGPVIKNLPAMYRMMKAFKSIDGEPEESEVESVEDKDEFLYETEIENSKDKNAPASLDKTDQNRRKSIENKGLSTPKLFI